MSRRKTLLPTFHCGDYVKWTSQAGGFAKTKYGVVVGIVPRGEALYKTYARLCLHKMPKGSGFARNHESYLVGVGRSYSKIYWPRVARLKRATMEEVTEL